MTAPAQPGVPVAGAGPPGNDGIVSERRAGSGRGPWARFFWLLFALAGLGVGVWLFGRRRHGSQNDGGWDPASNGSAGD